MSTLSVVSLKILFFIVYNQCVPNNNNLYLKANGYVKVMSLSNVDQNANNKLER